MINTVSSGVFHGRPFDEAVTLFKKKSVMPYTKTVASNDLTILLSFLK